MGLESIITVVEPPAVEPHVTAPQPVTLVIAPPHVAIVSGRLCAIRSLASAPHPR